MMKLSVKSQTCRPGTRFVTFTASLDSPYWKVIYKQQLAMSWGPATVFIHERLSPEGVTALLQAGGGAADTATGGCGGDDGDGDDGDDDGGSHYPPNGGIGDYNYPPGDDDSADSDDDYQLIEEENEWRDGNAYETDDFIVL
jgi:hypothetical protein